MGILLSIVQLPPQLQNLPLSHHSSLLSLGLGLLLLQPIRHLGSVGDGGDTGERRARPLGVAGTPRCCASGRCPPPPPRCRPQLPAVHPGLPLRIGAHHEPCMVHVRFHAIPPPPHPGDRQNPVPNQMSQPAPASPEPLSPISNAPPPPPLLQLARK